MRIVILLAIFSATTFSYAQDLKSGGRLKPEQAIMDIRHYTVALTVDPVNQTIEGTAEIDLILLTRVPDLVLDLWHEFTVTNVVVGTKKEKYFQTKDDLLKIRGELPFEKGKIKIKVTYGGKPIVAANPPWSGGFTWSTDSKGNPWIAITCQGEGAKIYFPCKDHPSDEPNEGADLNITVPAGLTVAGPGLLKKVVHEKTGGDTFYWSTAYTINNYSIVFNVGKYTKVSRPYKTIDGHMVPMDFYVLQEHADQGPHLLEILERSCRVQEKYFGEYPWVKEKIGVVETPHLGMEHQTMIAYGNKFKYTKLGGQDFDWLLHHEFGHEWWGNKITNNDWGHMWIQEGICTFGDALMTREAEGEDAYLKRMREVARRVKNEKAVVQGEEVDTHQAYQGDIYDKGAFFMHTLRFVLGDKVFFPALKKLATSSHYNYDSLVNTNEVEQFFSHESNKNLKPLFDFYLRTTKKLDVEVKQLTDSTYAVSLANFDGSLPMEVVTSEKSSVEQIKKEGLVFKSRQWPLVDPKPYYLKRVIQE